MRKWISVFQNLGKLVEKDSAIFCTIIFLECQWFIMMHLSFADSKSQYSFKIFFIVNLIWVSCFAFSCIIYINFVGFVQLLLSRQLNALIATGALVVPSSLYFILKVSMNNVVHHFLKLIYLEKLPRNTHQQPQSQSQKKRRKEKKSSLY